MIDIASDLKELNISYDKINVVRQGENSDTFLITTSKKKLIAKKFKTKKLIIEKKLSLNQIIEIDDFESFIRNLKGKRFITDNKTLSVIIALQFSGKNDLKFSEVRQKEALVFFAKSVYFFE